MHRTLTAIQTCRKVLLIVYNLDKIECSSFTPVLLPIKKTVLSQGA